jgi:hypothetical protein
MIKQLSFDDREEIKAVALTRNNAPIAEMGTLGNTPPSFDNRESFVNNLCFGFYTDDNELDAFIFINVWKEIAAYSCVSCTRNKELRVLNEAGVDDNLDQLWTHVVNYMGKTVGLWEHFEVTHPTSEEVGSEVSKRSLVDVVETVSRGQFSKYYIFRSHVLNRVLDHNVTITRYVVRHESR